VSQDQGNLDEARRLYEDALAIFRQIGDRPSAAVVLENLAGLARREGDDALAERLLGDV
jgi:hypothetical protein